MVDVELFEDVGSPFCPKRALFNYKKGRVGRLAHQLEVTRIINQHSDELEAVQIFEGEL